MIVKVRYFTVRYSWQARNTFYYFIDKLQPPIETVSVDNVDYCQLYCSDIVANCQMFTFKFRAGERSNCQLYNTDPFELINGCQIVGGARNEEPNTCQFPNDDCLVCTLQIS